MASILDILGNVAAGKASIKTDVNVTIDNQSIVRLVVALLIVALIVLLMVKFLIK